MSLRPHRDLSTCVRLGRCILNVSILSQARAIVHNVIFYSPLAYRERPWARFQRSDATCL